MLLTHDSRSDQNLALGETDRLLPQSDYVTSRATRVVLDTSVLVADPMSMLNFVGCDVVIPLTVVEELDGLKTRMDDVGRSARTALRTIEELRKKAGGSLAEQGSDDAHDSRSRTIRQAGGGPAGTRDGRWPHNVHQGGHRSCLHLDGAASRGH